VVTLIRLLPAACIALSSGCAFAGEAEWKARVDAGLAAYTRGDYQTAIARYQAALKESESFGDRDARAADTMSKLGLIYLQLARHDEAEVMLNKALSIRDKVLGPEHPDVAVSLSELGELYLEEARYADAEPLFLRALAIREKAFGPESVEVAMNLGHLVRTYLSDGRDEIIVHPFMTRMSAILKKGNSRLPEFVKLLSDHFLVSDPALSWSYAEWQAQTRRMAKFLGFSAAAVDDKKQFEQLCNRPGLESFVDQVSEKIYGSREIPRAAMYNFFAKTCHSINSFKIAELFYKRSIDILARGLGDEHPILATGLGDLALLYRSQNRAREALDITRRATDMLDRYLIRQLRPDRRVTRTERRRGFYVLEAHVSLLADVSARSGTMSQSQINEGFEAAQLARRSDTGEQIARMAVRFASGNDELGKLVRDRQDLLARAELVNSALLHELTRLVGERDAKHEHGMKEEQALIQRQVAVLDAQLDREFPRYRELANPKPLTLDAAQKLLEENEALVVFLVAQNESYVWAVRRGIASFQRLTITRSELESEIKKLRAQLDLGSVPNPESLVSKPFDVASAHALYRKLLAPVEGVLAGTQNILMVPDGALSGLPPGVLVTEQPQRPIEKSVDHAAVAWLAKRHAFTVLPSVSSLRALRVFARAAPGTEPFGGFGNPVLDGSPEQARGRTARALFSRGAVANVTEVRKFAPLPETADELRAIATSLKASSDALYLAQQATETNVKNLNLSRYRILAFATHGLMAGDFKGLAEPALVLTPPPQGTDLDDGLLTASEIAQLKLNADWVILSACNTAAPDGTPGAEGLSGLAKAFFYAGARSLLVSHWAVSTDAAVVLTTRMFEESANGASKAEALRRSMLALMARTDGPYFAHPAFWAPFVLVGEGNTTKR
jgi:CHAT domain-containing protein